MIILQIIGKQFSVKKKTSQVSNISSARGMMGFAAHVKGIGKEALELYYDPDERMRLKGKGLNEFLLIGPDHG
jgi:hypothetical protein